MSNPNRPAQPFPPGEGGTLELVDETLRDGSQSLWGMMMSYHSVEPVMREISEIGFASVDIPVNVATSVVYPRFFDEDLRTVFKMIGDKLQGTQSNILVASLGSQISVSSPPENRTAVRLVYEQFKEWVPQINQGMLVTCTQDELERSYPSMFKIWRNMGVEPIPYLAIGHGPRHTAEYYADVVKQIVEKYQPVSICFKDVDGLLTPERTRTILAACGKVANGTPFEFHLHGMNGLHNYTAVAAMEMGVRKFTTCIPPLANASSHLSVYDVCRNAEMMGISHNIDLEKCKLVEDRLTRIGKAADLPVDNHPLPFNLFTYEHQIPGGVISNTTTQLAQLGLEDKLQEVLEEIPRILEDLGHPVMITPFSQFIVTQAVLNIQVGRWEQCLDSCVELAAGMFGIEDAGVPYMDQNLKDKLLSLPHAKGLEEKATKMVEYINSEPSEAEVKAAVGLPADASREEFVLRHVLSQADGLKGISPNPETYRKYL